MVQSPAHKQAAESEPRGLDPDVLQRQASNPLESVWVGASAGTGKTKVLTDRVLRLLLPREDGRPGTAPHKILCLTFTKAGASEMTLRVGRRLSHWTTMAEPELEQDMARLLGRTALPEELTAARRLFAEVSDNPGGLKIMTIHSFCQSVLGRFPLEAELPPQFEILQEGPAQSLLQQALDDILRREDHDHPLKEAIDRLAAQLNGDQFAQMLRELSKERTKLARISQRWGADGLYTKICTELDIKPGCSAEEILLQACSEGAFAAAKLKNAADALEKGTPASDQQSAAKIHAFLAADTASRPALFAQYSSAFFTHGGDIKKTLATSKVQQNFPDCAAILTAEAERLLQVKEHISRAENARLTTDLFTLGEAILQRYTALKQAQGVLDFDDLILKTLELLQSRASWVMYKLDQGLDHILVDEAQDTNPEQWQIIESLCNEFFVGKGAKDDITRTLFVVGDLKQSIYSFQRANPAEFTRRRAFFAEKIQEAGEIFQPVDMNISFRSVPAVLAAVDSVFSRPDAAKGLGEAGIGHSSHRTGQAGRVELWPLLETKKKTPAQPWAPPLEISESSSGPAALATKIARTIRDWLDQGEMLPSHGRPVQAGDIMILVRTRTAFFNQLARALKNLNIPVSGVDRMVLNEQLAVQDLLALAHTALLPEDDLTLATILKSPLIGWDEDRLYQLAIERPGSLWSAMPGASPEKTYLRQLVDFSSHLRPHEFFSHILNTPCPADTRSGWSAIRARLGDEALDPLDELLNAALAFEAENIPDLQSFLHWQEHGSADIKREMEEAGGQVRIMTVHGAKGLQAPIVFLPDTTRTSRSVPGQSAARLLWDEDTNTGTPLWSPRKDADSLAYTQAFDRKRDRLDEEYRRLLYVAMTRSEDRLYVCGYKGIKGQIQECWYEWVKAGLAELKGLETLEDGALRLDQPQAPGRDPDRTHKGTRAHTEAKQALPDWAYKPAPEEPDPPRPLQPSRPSQPEPAALSPLQSSQSQRFLRGNLTHKLLQFLPDLSPDQREKAAMRFLEAQAGNVSASGRAGILSEVLAILQHPEFAQFFDQNTLAEVPVTGRLPDGRVISGQIDRLLVTKAGIWIIDYKTNRPPPKLEKDIPPYYRDQLAAYAHTLQAIYPGRKVHTALLWTDGPRLMPVRL